MGDKAHQKHVKLARPDFGEWGRCEFAILGNVCSDILSYAIQIKDFFYDTYSVAYIDASHSDESEFSNVAFASVQHADHWQFSTNHNHNLYQSRLTYFDTDIQIVNGNHFTASRQIVFLDDRKKESLERKLDRLTDVKFIVKKSEDQEVYSFLKRFVNEHTIIISEENIPKLCERIQDIKLSSEKINGLILAGGKSTRMGSDKAQINYHGQSQVDYLSEQLKQKCTDVFVSVRKEQASDYSIPVISDTYANFGPLGGILSAFRHDPNSAWLTIATDLPFVSEEAIDELFNHRDKSKIATCFIKSGSEFPDPLFTIWEPKAYKSLLNFLILGYSCPRKVLINSDVKVVPISDDQILMNVNNPEELEKAKKIIQNSN